LSGDTELIRIWKEDKKSVTLESSLTALDDCMEPIASAIQPRCWLFINGDLGAGKTTFISMLLKAMGYHGVVSSPTFSIVNVMHFVGKFNSIGKACHLDLYRLKKASELMHLGLEVEFTGDSFCIFEWAEKIDAEDWADFFNVTLCRRPAEIMTVNIEYQKDSDNRIYTFGWLDPNALLP
jgi:tRNA threonylcarbamoyladenosine biosynthesis protein TsaE